MHYHPQESNSTPTAMPAAQKAESTLTDRYQTTVPKSVRSALNLGKRDQLQYTIRASGEVLLTRVEPSSSDDPVLGQFLDLLERDMSSRPQALKPLTVGLFQRIDALVGEVQVDLGARLLEEDE